MLSFTLNADRNYGISRSDMQWIFIDRLLEDGQRIAVKWISACDKNENEGDCLNNLRLRIQHNNQLKLIDVETPNVHFDNDLLIKLQFDGKYCMWFLNDTKVGDSIDCAGGFTKLGSPITCTGKFNDRQVQSGWRGKIMDLKFENFVLVKDSAIGEFLSFNKKYCVISYK